MGTTTKDWIGLVETSYSLDGDDDAWMNTVLAHAAPLSDRGVWPTIDPPNSLICGAVDAAGLPTASRRRPSS